VQKESLWGGNFAAVDAAMRATRLLSPVTSQAPGGKRVIQLRHQQPSLWESLFAEEGAELWEPWMRLVDELLEDEELLDAVYDAQGKRHPQSRTRGAAADSRRPRAAHAGPETRAQLELRNPGTGSTSQRGLAS